MKDSLSDYLKIYGSLLLLIIVLGVAVTIKDNRTDAAKMDKKYVLVDIIKVGDDKIPAEFEVYRNIEDGSFKFVGVE